jgi:RNA polymerase sigma-70 factor (ECF subfamily)
VSPPEATCWTLIHDAARGDPVARDRFARVYLPVVKAYLSARWRDAARDADDAAQDVFVQCFKAGGILERAAADRPGGFRAYLLGAVRNVARRQELRRRPVDSLPDGLPGDDTGPEQAFDRAWARALLREAAAVQQQSAERAGPAAVRRVDLLRLRFHDGLPIRDIAQRWGEDPAKLHREYATARDEFRAALKEVIAFHHPTATPGEWDRLAAEFLALVG